MMIDIFLKKAILRHFNETRSFISDLIEDTISDMFKSNVIKPTQILFKIPAKDGRSLGQVLLHMIRSMEFYIRGIVKNVWEPIFYSLTAFPTLPKILNLYDSVTAEMTKYLDEITTEDLEQNLDSFNRLATKGEILLEMLEHSLHHRGQLSVYLRLLGINPPEISYII